MRQNQEARPKGMDDNPRLAKIAKAWKSNETTPKGKLDMNIT